jgi:hypothetical protein
MTDPVSISLLVASTVLSAGSTIMAGQAQKRAGEFEAEQARAAAEDARIQGMQEANAGARGGRPGAAAERRASVRCRGWGTEGGSFMAVQSEVQRKAENDMENIRYNALTQANRFSLQGQQARSAGNAAAVGSYFGAGTTLLKGGYGVRQNLVPAPKTSSSATAGQFPTIP